MATDPNNPTSQPQVQPQKAVAVGDAGMNYGLAGGSTPAQAGWSADGFKSITGRDPTADETNYYKDRPNGLAENQYNQDNSGGSGGGSNAPQAPTSGVTATGGIPPPAPVAAATPAGVGQQRDARTAAPVAAAPTYQPGQISQFNAPDQSGSNTQQSNLMSAIMAHPETLDANTIAQMKEQQKEQALMLGQQSNSAYAQSAVGRGTLNGGQTAGYRQNTDQNVNNAILSGNRNVDLSAVATNRQDQLNALGASSNLAQDQLGRATSSYGTGLQGQLAQAGQNFQGYQSQQAANQAAYDRAMGYASQAQQNYGQDLQAQFGNQAANLDVQKFLAQQDQFNKGLNYNYYNTNVGNDTTRRGQDATVGSN